MLKRLCVMGLLLAVLAGCAGAQPGIPGAILEGNALEQISKSMDQYVRILARDWPKASAAIRAGIGTDQLPKVLADQMDEIDALYQHEDGTWLTPKEVDQLDEYTKWYAAFARLRHTGPIMRAIIDVYMPGLASLPQVVTVLGFLGLGAL